MYLRVIDVPNDLQATDAVVLPGVGSFAAARQHLSQAGWDRVIIDRFRNRLPTLAVCLGMQLLCDASEESPGVQGLGILPGMATSFPEGLLKPQLGWNQIHSSPASDFFEDGFVYYANSFRLIQKPEGWEVATSDYGGEFVAAVRRGPLLACQFHPELSGPLGSRLLKRWLLASRQTEPAPC